MSTSRRTPPSLTALAAALTLLGCATPAPQPVAGTVAPVQIVRHGVDAQSLYRTGRYFQGQLRFDEAIAAYKQALSEQPAHADALNALGVIYSQQGRAAQAELAFRQAMAAAPQVAAIRNNLGYHLMVNGRLAEAVAAFEQASALEPGNDTTVANLATARNKLGLAPGEAPALVAGASNVVTAAPAVAPAPQAETAPAAASQAAVVVTPPAAAPQVVEIAPAAAASPVAPPSAVAPPVVIAAPPAAAPQVVAIASPTSVTAAAESTAATPAAAPAARLERNGDSVWTLRDAPLPAKGAVAVAQASIEVYPRSAMAPPVPREPMAQGRVEIANGNGITGLARRLSGLLAPLGWDRSRLTNDKPFGVAKSRIQYVAGAEQMARDLNASLPVQLPMTRVDTLERNARVRVLLGKDFPPQAVADTPISTRSTS